MANDNHVNIGIGSDLDIPLDSRMNVISSVSFLSDSTFSESDFEHLDDTQDVPNDQSNDARRTQDAALYDNDGIGNLGITSGINTTEIIEGKDQYTNSRSQQSYLYANDDMLRQERENVPSPLPRRNGRGRKIAQRMSTIPSSVWHKVHGWPRLETATVSLVCFVTGVGLCILFYLAYKFIDKVYSTQYINEGNHCKVLDELKGCIHFIHHRDEMKTFESFSAKCSKIQKKFIKDQKYIIYDDKVSFVEAMAFCHRVARLDMVHLEEIECRNLKKLTVPWNEATGYWIGSLFRPNNEVSSDNITGSWHNIEPTDEIKLLTNDSCAYIQTKSNNEKCYSASKCLEKTEEKFPICKC